MCKLILDRGNFAEFTSVSNIFIDEYMPKANGEFIKIYLHLLRLVCSGNDADAHSLSTEMIADRFNMLESDVNRALNYWAKQGLLSLSFNEKKEITGITLESALRSHYIVKGVAHTGSHAQDACETQVLAKASGESVSSPVPEASGVILPAKKKYTSKELSAFQKDERVAQLTFLAQTYLGKTLSPSDINSILYMLDGLCLDMELIEYIIESCISNNHKTLSYMEKQAVDYAQRGITTVEEAKADEKLRRSIYKSIYKIFGHTPKAPVRREMDYIAKWSDQYGFSDEIILEACSRTMEHTHSDSFPYADSILTNWHQCNAKSIEDIEKLDKTHSEEVKKMYKPSCPTAKNTRPKNARTFQEREYDYGSLENRLRNSQNQRIKKILSTQSEENQED